MKKQIIIVFIFLLSNFGMFILGNYRGSKSIRYVKDTLVVTREIEDSSLVLFNSIPKGYELVRVGTIDSLKAIASKPKIIEREVVKEVPKIVLRDSVIFIHVPIEERVFTGNKGMVDYTITAIGYNTSISNVSFRYPEKTINVERVVRESPIGFSIGVGPYVGYGIKGFDIGVGIFGGLTYKF